MRAHPAWSTTPITPSHIGQIHCPILPTSNFSLAVIVIVTVIVTATTLCSAQCLCATRSRACQDCNVGPSSSCAATTNLDLCPFSLFSSVCLLLSTTRKAPTQLKEIRLQAQQLHHCAQGADSTPSSGPSACSAHHFLPEVAIRQT
ncbi:hypothetical protein N8I77_009024 [Diaporthe amygdali]|uniref:Uncharacterized protein n=1 Tax=Phomopsis amygdali TaxID=1214568 RepID=A0AAD9W2T3_PHOAM|nr:hypothetical protein N8I77_009024 [Diaporthe amygdali]